MRLAPTSDLWWKNAVVYCLDVETFHHDFDGLIDHIDHVADLGATCIWLMPFYPTPNQDDGYDISDYLGVDPRLGDLGDVPEAIRHATDRGLRVLADLVCNHTSIQHPWFQVARADPGSPYRAYYVWSDDPSKEKGTTPDNWTFDDEAGRYYMHRFQPFQPDLDITNPEVRHQIAKTVGFWLQLGVSGFRMDAVPFLVETVGTDEAGSDEPRRWLHELREFALRRRGDAMLMGEVNVEVDQLESYFEDHGDALHLQLGFLINQRAVAVARARRGGAARGPDPHAPGAAAGQRLGDVPAQPRRAVARQARRGRARRRLRGVRAGEEHADLRPRHPPPGRRACSAATARGCGWRGRCCSRCPGRR